MIEERLMAAGRWQMQLRSDTPQRVLDLLDPAVNGFATVLVVDGPIDPGVGITGLRSVARWSGIFRRREDLTISGAGLAALLGDEDGKGPIIHPAVSRSAGTLSQWLGDLLPANGIDTGTVTNTGNSATNAFDYVTVRAAIDAICDTCGAEWRLNPDLTVDAAAPATLFPTATTPTAIVSRIAAGRDGTTFAIAPERLGVDQHVEEYSTEVVYLARDTTGGTTITTVTAASVPFKAPGGDDLVMTRVIDAAWATDADSAALAQAQLDRFSVVSRGVYLTSDEHDLPARVRPGDTVHVYDPYLGLIDTDNPVQRGNDVLFPVDARALMVSWPVRAGLGIYFVTPEASPELVDLTPYIVPEESVTTVEVGVSARTLANGGTFISSAYRPGSGSGGSGGGGGSRGVGGGGSAVSPIVTIYGTGGLPIGASGFGSAVDIQEFATAGPHTWTKPAGALYSRVVVIGAGAGGGSGARSAQGTNRTGGSGGSGGGVSVADFEAAALGSTEDVEVGAGGTGGAAQTANDTNGNNGTSGGSSWFGTGDYDSGTPPLLGASGGTVLATTLGNYGRRDATQSNMGGLVGYGGVYNANNNTGVSGSAFGGGVATPSNTTVGGSGGGAISNGTPGTVYAAAASVFPQAAQKPPGSVTANGAGQGVNGADGTLSISYQPFTGSGGAGGGPGDNAGTVAAGNGGAGIRGSGGGGGGGSTNGANSGAGGDGGDGYVLVITWCAV